MFKMSISSKYHADAKLVTAIDRVLVADGASRLHDGGNAGFVSQFHAIIEGEESIGSQHRTLEVEAERMGLLNGLAQSIHPGGLTDARSA